jgi:prevent-host-death family protein
MNVVTTLDFQTHLNQYLDTILNEPVIVEHHGKQVAALVSYHDYQHFQNLEEDAYWVKMALEAKQEGFVDDGLGEWQTLAQEKLTG